MTDLRALLGDRYESTVEKAASTLYGRNYSTPWPEKGHADRFCWVTDAAAVLAAVLPDLLAAAWDEGCLAGDAAAFNGHINGHPANPYKPTEESA